ncbi:MAG: TfoX/Sxy family protein [Saonia sp.]
MWEEKLNFYDALINRNPNIERKGKTMPYTSVNGHMFSQLNKAGEIGIRLPKDKREQFMKEYCSAPFKSYGAVMKEYVLVPETLWKDVELLSSYVEAAHDYAKSLKSKA